MNAIRTLISALAIVAGAFFIAWWALASVVVTAVEDGTAVRGITERALDSPAVLRSIREDVTTRAEAALAERGIDVVAFGLADDLDRAIEAGVESEAFRVAVLDQVDDAHEQVADQLTADDRAPAPLTISVDMSDALNSRIDELGGPASAVPDLSIPPVTFEAVGADSFEQARVAYERTEWAKRWALWIGVGLLLLGAIMSHRRRWFLAKALLAFGVLCVLFGGVIALLGPETITTFMPGGEEGTLAAFWREVVTEEAAPVLMERAFLFGGVALVGSLVFTALGMLVGDRRR